MIRHPFLVPCFVYHFVCTVLLVPDLITDLILP